MLYDGTSDGATQLKPRDQLFEYQIKLGEYSKHVSLVTQIPPGEAISLDECVSHLCATNDVLPPLKDGVENEFHEWVDQQTHKFECEVGDAVINDLLNRDGKCDPQVPRPESQHSVHDSEAQKFAEQFQFLMRNSDSDRIKFVIAYERKMEEDMTALVRARDFELDRMHRQCEKTISSCSSGACDDSEQKITQSAQLISSLNERIREVGACYNQQIQELTIRQRNEYRNLIKSLYEHDKLPSGITTDGIMSYALNRSATCSRSFDHSDPPIRRLDESFTIYLGAQLKTMHNARIISSSGLGELIRASVGETFDSQRLQMNLSLYGCEMTGLVLLVGQDPMQHISERTELTRFCERSTELHFDSLEQQLVNLTTLLNNRKQTIRNGCGELLEPGDLYLTRHSNVPIAQVVLHLVVDETIQADDINSRHPCINGLRNAITISSKCGITTFYIPLLLIEKSSNVTTTAWCIKRAELLFKCIKGFMMEACAGNSCAGVPSATTHYNVNFVIPDDLDAAVYSHILELFPTIFHLVPSVSV